MTLGHRTATNRTYPPLPKGRLSLQLANPEFLRRARVNSCLPSAVSKRRRRYEADAHATANQRHLRCVEKHRIEHSGGFPECRAAESRSTFLFNHFRQRHFDFTGAEDTVGYLGPTRICCGPADAGGRVNDPAHRNPHLEVVIDPIPNTGESI